METKLAIFQEKTIRKIWNETEMEWYFSIIDVIEVLTDSDRPRKYWNDLKTKLKKEWSQLSEKIGQLSFDDDWGNLPSNIQQMKMKAKDWKYYLTDVANTENILRLIQSIPSKKAEPFKLWLAKVWNERINEIWDPEIAIERAISLYRKKGYDENWIAQRLKSIDIRKELTYEWQSRGINEWLEYAILTNEILQEWSWMNTAEYKTFKWLKKESLKDNMTNLELVLNMLAEASTTEILKKEDSQWFDKVEKAGKKWWKVAWIARKAIENETKESIISKENLLPKNERNKIEY